jgi:SAM-dependent MidA family methyltransferase
MIDVFLPSADAKATSGRLTRRIAAEIAAAGGFLPFARFMELALYAPGLGYYSAGAHKFGEAGDFVTAPEISPLFGRTLARQVAELIGAGLTDVLELGAGSGALAHDLLHELAALGRNPRRYLILETSADLRQRQQQRLRTAAGTVEIEWLDQLPVRFSGIVVANEVLDALPVHLVRRNAGDVRESAASADDIDELGVDFDERHRTFVWRARPAAGEVAAAARVLDLPSDYTTELHLAARGLVRSLGAMLERGVMLFIDYGFPAREYYHPQRNRGTLMCHYRHRAHDDPLQLPGLQDITAHVDFSAIAAAAHETGLETLGYTTQAQFLINCGITDILAETPATDAAAYLPLAAAAQKLLGPAEMGELFKVLALGRHFSAPLLGFRSGDRCAAL